jgi:hypothetical protein
MIASALLYPFALLKRRPITLLIALCGYWVLWTAIDIAFSLANFNDVDPFRSVRDAAVAGGKAIAQIITAAFPAALVIVAALRDLERRDKGFRLMDGVTIALLSVMFFLAIAAPFVGLAVVSFNAITPQLASVWPAIALMAFWACIAIFVYCRLSVAWPQALVRGRISAAAAWSMTRGRFWRIVSALLPAFALSMGLTQTADWLSNQWLAQTLPIAAGSFEGVFSPLILGETALNELLASLHEVYFTAVTVYVYHRIAPPRADAVADIF